MCVCGGGGGGGEHFVLTTTVITRSHQVIQKQNAVKVITLTYTYSNEKFKVVLSLPLVPNDFGF